MCANDDGTMAAAYDDPRRLTRMQRVQPQRRARFAGPSYRRQEEYTHTTFCVRLQAGELGDIIRRHACLADNVTLLGEGAESFDLIVTPSTTLRSALAFVQNYEPPLLVPPQTQLDEDAIINRLFIPQHSILDTRAGVTCDVDRSNVVVRVSLETHVVVVLWVVAERRLELFNSNGLCEGGEPQMIALDRDWTTRVLNLVATVLGIHPPYTRTVVCPNLQRSEHEEGGYCQTWVWFWMYHRLVRGCPLETLLARIEAQPTAAIERFKAEASAERVIITGRYC